MGGMGFPTESEAKFVLHQSFGIRDSWLIGFLTFIRFPASTPKELILFEGLQQGCRAMGATLHSVAAGLPRHFVTATAGFSRLPV